MKENHYDNPRFFDQYSRMDRSVKGLSAAGEWHALEKLLPSFADKRVLDLGCGFGWHCRYAAEHGAAQVTGTDLSENMLAEARAKTDDPRIRYLRMAMEDLNFPLASFDVVLSSLAFHYVADFPGLCQRVWSCLSPGGAFVFSVEHPVFTAFGNQQWIDDEQGNHLHWPVDRYFSEGKRSAIFLGEPVTKYHRTLTTYLNGLLSAGFLITGVTEPQPAPHLRDLPEMADELRRPMMLLVGASKPY